MPHHDPKVRSQYNRAYREAHREKLAANDKARRQRDPEATKRKRRERYERRPELEKEQHRRWVAANREQVNRKRREYYLRKPEVHRRQALRSYQKHKENRRLEMQLWSEKNRTKVLEYKRKWYQRNRDNVLARVKLRAEFKAEEIKAKASAHYKANPEKYHAHRMLRRAREAGAKIGSNRRAYCHFLATLRKSPKVPCYWCGTQTTSKNRHIDHIIPLARGGRDDVYNLAASCAGCNLSKNAKSPEVFSGQYELSFISGG